MRHTNKTQQDPNRRSHPFHPSHKDLSHASSSRKSRQYKRTIYRQTQRNRKQENQTKMTAKQNTYNFSRKRPKQTRSKHSDTKHEEQSNQPTRHPKFNRQHRPPISLPDASRTFPRAPIQNNEIKKGTRGGILNNFSTNQTMPRATRQMFKSTNMTPTSSPTN